MRLPPTRVPPTDRLSWRAAPIVATTDLLRCHEHTYVSGIKKQCADLLSSGEVRGKLDADTELTAYSYHAALRAAGAAVAATHSVCAPNRTARNAFCATRPPGHHAGPAGAVGDQSAGFCLFCNAAIAASYAMHVSATRM